MKPSGSKNKERRGVDSPGIKVTQGDRKEADKGAGGPDAIAGRRSHSGGVAIATTKTAGKDTKSSARKISYMSRTPMKRAGTAGEGSRVFAMASCNKGKDMNAHVGVSNRGQPRNKGKTKAGANVDSIVVVISSDSEYQYTSTESDSSAETQMYSGGVVLRIKGKKYVAANAVKTKLWYPYKSQMELDVDDDWGETRWIDIRTSAGRAYKVKLVKMSNYYTLTDGWTLVAVCERLKPGLNVCFRYYGSNITLEIMSQTQDAHKRGFADATSVDRQVHRSTHCVYRGEGGTLDGETEKAIIRLRAAANARHTTAYVCTINKSQTNEMYFSTQFSEVLPHKKETVALRFVGSPVAISGSIRRYGKACTKIMNGWKAFVAEHKINQGDRIAIQCYQGPNVYEMMVCRV